MDEEITIIDINTRNEKIKNFFKENKKLLISIFIVLVLILVSFYSYQIYKNVHREILANKYNSAVIEYEKGDKSKVTSLTKEVIEDKGVKVLIDPNAVMYLLGTEMDYKKEKFSSQFVFKNPNETERCGCGESFKV